MNIFLSGTYLSTFFSTTPLFSLVDLYFTWIIISPPLIKPFSSQSRFFNLLYKGEPSPHFRHPLLCYRYATGLESNFEEGVLNTKAFVENFYLLVSFSLAPMAFIMRFYHCTFILVQSHICFHRLDLAFIDQILFSQTRYCIFIIQISLHLHFHVYLMIMETSTLAFSL